MTIVNSSPLVRRSLCATCITILLLIETLSWREIYRLSKYNMFSWFMPVFLGIHVKKIIMVLFVGYVIGGFWGVEII